MEDSIQHPKNSSCCLLHYAVWTLASLSCQGTAFSWSIVEVIQIQEILQLYRNFRKLFNIRLEKKNQFTERKETWELATIIATGLNVLSRKRNAVLTKQVRKKQIMAMCAVVIVCIIHAVIPRWISGSARSVWCEIRWQKLHGPISLLRHWEKPQCYSSLV